MEVSSATAAVASPGVAPKAAAASSTQAAYIDSEGTPLDFDPSLSEDERRFYMKAYPSIELVRERKVHCTICKMHIGTAPSQESIIKMHPILRVTHCTKCHDFYNSGEFSKGEDGSELYCRWCGQGGEVYCCSNCPYVFCKSCIVKNLSRGVVADIEQNENWSCFSCAPKILWPLRAQHWALVNYIDKQKKAIQAMNISESEKKPLLAKDRSNCCRLAKAKCGNMSDSMESLDSTTSRRSHGSSNSTKKTHKLPMSSPQTQMPAAKRAKTSNDEVVCTPDLLSMLEPDCQLTMSHKSRPIQSPVATKPKVISIQSNYNHPMHPNNNTPPPLVLRNTGVQLRTPMSSTPIVRRTVIGARTPTPTSSNAPVYHTINGFRIDLNTAAQQETFRLPNGKLIQVKRQGTQQHQNPGNSWAQQQQQQQRATVSIQAHPHPNQRPIQITQGNAQPSHYLTVQQPTVVSSQTGHHLAQQQPQVMRYHNTTVTPVNNHNGAQIQVINGVPTAPAANVTQTTVRAPIMVRHVFPDTAIGQARSQLQDQVFNAMEICQHLTGKVQTLTNSNAYKQARNYLEVKELYIHLSYLLTYAIGRFKGLQDKCLNDMRQLGFVNDADSLENGQLAADKQASDDEDNEIEIVEPKTDTITLDSDNEDEVQSTSPDTNYKPAVAQNTVTIKATPTSSVNGTVAPSTPVPSVSSSVTKPNSTTDVELMSAAQTLLASLLEVDLTDNDQSAAQASSPAGSSDSTQKKQPRKKTTNKPNPTLLKQKEMMERERLEEMKRNDLKLKMKCAISLTKAEDEYPFAKGMLQEKEVANSKDCKEASEGKQEEVIRTEEKEECKESKQSVMEKPDGSESSNSAANEVNDDEVEILSAIDGDSSLGENKNNVDSNKEHTSSTSDEEKQVRVEPTKANREKETLVRDKESTTEEQASEEKKVEDNAVPSEDSVNVNAEQSKSIEVAITSKMVDSSEESVSKEAEVLVSKDAENTKQVDSSDREDAIIIANTKEQTENIKEPGSSIKDVNNANVEKETTKPAGDEVIEYMETEDKVAAEISHTKEKLPNTPVSGEDTEMEEITKITESENKMVLNDVNTNKADEIISEAEIIQKQNVEVCHEKCDTAKEIEIVENVISAVKETPEQSAKVSEALAMPAAEATNEAQMENVLTEIDVDMKTVELEVTAETQIKTSEKKDKADASTVETLDSSSENNLNEPEIDVDKEIEKLLKNKDKDENSINETATGVYMTDKKEVIPEMTPTNADTGTSSPDLLADINELIENENNAMT